MRQFLSIKNILTKLLMVAIDLNGFSFAFIITFSANLILLSRSLLWFPMWVELEENSCAKDIIALQL